MALRVKTIEYAFPFATESVASGTARDFTSITVAIPENNSRTFRSVILEVTACDNVTTAASLTSVLMGISISPAARLDSPVSQTLANSGENQSFIFTRNFTSYFQTNFTGTSHTVGARLTISGVITINCTAKLIITYEYDDTSQTTRIKTVKIPIDGNTGNLTTTLENVGDVADQIPALDTFLPEDSKVYRDIFFEINGHNGGTSTGTTSSTLTMRYNGSTSLESGAYQASLASDYWIRRIDKIITGETGAIATNTTNTVQANTSSTDMLFPCLSGVLVVTYEYNEDETTSVIQSLQIAAIDEAGWSGGPTSADKGRFNRTILIPEPGPITLVQSGILASYIDGAAVSMTFNIGDQTNRTFVHGATVRCGGMHHMRRFDSGAVGGAGATLDRGFNNIQIDFWTSGTATGTLGSNLSALIYLNYISSKCNLGTCAQTKTTTWINRQYTTGLVERLQYTSLTTPVIPETNWYSIGIGYEGKVSLSGTSIGSLAFCFQTEIQSDEANGAGWRDFYNTVYSSDPERGPSIIWARARDDYKRHPRDVNSNRLDPTIPRDFRFDVSQNATTNWQAFNIFTYHSITFEVSGSISGSNGGTVTLDLIRSDTNEVVDSKTKIGDGTYSFVWYDNTVDMFVVAYESDTKKGISIKGIAGTDTFDINLSAGGEYGYGFA
jgi:hypothetical protein